MPPKHEQDRGQTMDWEAFFVRYRSLALRSIRGRVPSGDTAEDLFQDAARSLYERVIAGELEFESEAHARNYLFRALHNLAVSNLRRRATDELNEEPTAPDSEPWRTSAGEEEGARRVDRVNDAIRTLAPKEREALRMRYVDELTFREMSARTGTAISTLQGRVETALQKIRGRVGNEGGSA